MARLCERPGCSTPAGVTYGFDAEQLVVWIDGFHAAQGARAGVLCRRHADAMVVPLGWMLDDRREPVPRLFKVVPHETPMPRSRRARTPRDATGEQLRLDATMLDSIIDDDAAPAAPLAEAEVGAVAVAEAESQVVALDAPPPTGPESESVEAAPPPGPATESAPEAPWQPHFDETDDLHGLLNARGRLLSRAFQGFVADD